MGTQLRNEADVQAWLMPKINIIVHNIMNGIATLNEDLIQQIVYNTYSPKRYERTGEFKEAWEYETPKISNNHVTSKFKYKPEAMVYDPELGQHGTPQEYVDRGVQMAPSREYLADIIYGGVTDGLFLGKWSGKRDAWDVLVKAVGTSKMRAWIEIGAKNAGIAIKWHHLPKVENNK